MVETRVTTAWARRVAPFYSMASGALDHARATFRQAAAKTIVTTSTFMKTLDIIWSKEADLFFYNLCGKITFSPVTIFLNRINKKYSFNKQIFYVLYILTQMKLEYVFIWIIQEIFCPKFTFYFEMYASETEDILFVIILFFLLSEYMTHIKVPEQPKSITDTMRINKIITLAVSFVILWRT